MSSSYAVRANAIQAIAKDLRRTLELVSVGSVTDMMHAIDVGVEVINKILYSFLVSKDLYESVSADLNAKYKVLQPNPYSVCRLHNLLLSVVRRFETSATVWVDKYK